MANCPSPGSGLVVYVRRAAVTAMSVFVLHLGLIRCQTNYFDLGCNHQRNFKAKIHQRCMTESFEIFGGRKLKGELEVRGSKNAAFPVLAACLLTTRPCVITNLPLIEDVARMLELLSSFGAKVERLGTRKVRISCEQLVISEQSKTNIGKFRGLILS